MPVGLMKCRRKRLFQCKVVLLQRSWLSDYCHQRYQLSAVIHTSICCSAPLAHKHLGHPICIWDFPYILCPIHIWVSHMCIHPWSCTAILYALQVSIFKLGVPSFLKLLWFMHLCVCVCVRVCVCVCVCVCVSNYTLRTPTQDSLFCE